MNNEEIQLIEDAINIQELGLNVSFDDAPNEQKDIDIDISKTSKSLAETLQDKYECRQETLNGLCRQPSNVDLKIFSWPFNQPEGLEGIYIQDITEGKITYAIKYYTKTDDNIYLIINKKQEIRDIDINSDLSKLPGDSGIVLAKVLQFTVDNIDYHNKLRANRL